MSAAGILGIHDVGLFIAAGLLLNITPGPDLLITTLRASTAGFRAGAITALGIGAGSLVHVALGALGLSALLSTWSSGFAMVKWAGAFYLIYLGMRMLFNAGAPQASTQPVPQTLPGGRLFLQGVLTNLLNPKVVLFFLAFVPQFIDARSASFGAAFVALGRVFVINGTLVTVGFAWLAARAGRQYARGRRGAWLNRLLGLTFIGLGLRLALMDTR